MKNKLFPALSWAALLCLVLLSACSSDNDMTQNSTPHKVTITATQPSTRMGYDSNGTGYWQAGDTIGIWSDADNKFIPFTLTSGAGEASATFTGEVSGELGANAIAFYPYSKQLAYDGNETFSCKLPSTYTYDKVNTEYSQKDGNSFGMPMFGNVEGEGTENRTITFKSLGSLIAIKIERMFSTEGTIVVTDDNNALGGTVEYYDDDSGKGFRYASDATNIITFNYKNAEIGKPGIFYIPVLAGSYEVKIKVVEKERNNFEFTTKSSRFNLERTHIKRLNVRHDYTTTINGETAIDMGGKVLWAEHNVGAKYRADAGNYYAWGETTPKEVYTAETLTYKGDEINASNDAATVNWGAPWCIPTSEEIENLLNSCPNEQVNLTNSSGETVKTYKLTNNTMQHYIFVPCVGDIYESTNIRTWVAEFWSNTRNITWGSYLMAYIFCIEKDEARLTSCTRNNGLPVRAVVPIHDFKLSVWE